MNNAQALLKSLAAKNKDKRDALADKYLSRTGLTKAQMAAVKKTALVVTGDTITDLPASTQPLTGTELLPLVQSGQTRKATVNDILNIAKLRKLHADILEVVAGPGTDPTDFQTYEIPADTCKNGGDTIAYESNGSISYSGGVGDTLEFYFSGQLLYTFTASNVGSLQTAFDVDFQVTYLNAAQGNFFIKVTQGPHTGTDKGVVALLDWEAPIEIKTVGAHLSGAGSFTSTQLNVYLK